jgi:hypothetical protein
VEVAEKLLAVGAAVGAKDRDGKTPLDKAVQYNKPAVAALLREWRPENAGAAARRGAARRGGTMAGAPGAADPDTMQNEYVHHQAEQGVFAGPTELTVGTWNLLHPTYAVKYREVEGIYGRTKSNWPDRAPEIGDRLLKGGLDVYLLQEVGQAQLDDLQPYVSQLYELRFAAHPGRGAKDGVAVLVRKARLQIEEDHTLEILAKEKDLKGQHYMSAMLVTARDVATGARVLAVSAHFYAKKAVDPRGTLLAELARRFAGDNPPELVVWGGDCNEVYRAPFFGGAFCTADGRCPTRFRGTKKIDWIFVGGAALSGVVRSEATQKFVKASSEAILATGQPPSDHLAEAVSIRMRCDCDARASGGTLAAMTRHRSSHPRS